MARWSFLPPDDEPEFLERIVRSTPAAAILTALGAAAVWHGYRHGPAGTAVTLWLATFIAISLARLAIAARLARGADAASPSQRAWLRAGVAGSLAQTAAWSLLSVVLHAPGTAEAEAVLHIVLTGAITGAAIHLSMLSRALEIYTALLLGPLIVRNLLIGDEFHLLISGLLGLLCIGTLFNGRLHATALREVLVQRRRNAELAQALASENARAEAALRAASEASAARTRFFAAANHDLRQPLHAMGLLVHTLVTEGGSAAERSIATHLVDCVDGMTQVVDGMTQVVDDLLELTRMDAGSLAPTIGTHSLDALVQEVCRPLGAMARAKGLAFGVDVPALPVRTDGAMLARVLANLVSNAIRYTPVGRIDVDARPQADDHVVLTVRDTGIGIAPEHLPRIFDEFYQVGNPGRDRRLGLGLGLATVKRLSDLLDLDLRVTSRPGRGSAFSLRLRRAGDDAPAPAIERGADASPLLAGRSVLVIEDDVDSREALVRLLRAWDCDARGTPGGLDALTLVQRGFRPDALVVDLRLGDGEHGVDAVRRLRAALGRPDLPAAVVTGDAGGPATDAAQADALPVMTKPVRPARLRAFLAQAFAARQDG